MLKKEEGFILPLMLGVLLIVSSLLLLMSAQIEIKASSYARTQAYLRLNVLEAEALQLIRARASEWEVQEDWEDLRLFDHFRLERGAILMLDVSFGSEHLAIRYQIHYNESMRERRLLYFFDGGSVFLE